MIENSLPAFDRAIARGFAIECDVQLTADGTAVVFHDFTLDRLTEETGPVAERTADALAELVLKGSRATIPTLARTLAHVDGRTPLIIELKSAFDGETELAEVVADMLNAYHGPVAAMSFDPAMVRAFRKRRTGAPAGIVAAPAGYAGWPELGLGKRLALGALVTGPALRADFVSYEHGALPALAPLVARWIARKPLVCWTVRNREAARRAYRFADQITFEGFDPHGLQHG